VTNYSTVTQTVISTPPAITQTGTVTATVTDRAAETFYSTLMYLFLVLFVASLGILAVSRILGRRTKAEPTELDKAKAEVETLKQKETKRRRLIRRRKPSPPS
jgi:beta-lactamase regulating signal transducer with metallopeptidase domain